MPENVEIKARVDDPVALAQRVATLASDGPHLLVQHDTFFQVPSGRLKLRRFGDRQAELIAYHRPDQAGPKTSTFERASITDADALEHTLTVSLGTAGVVAKRRTLFRIGRTRVHLDEVDGLGAFVELEVVMKRGEPIENGEREAHALLDQLRIERADLVEGAYVDLLR